MVRPARVSEPSRAQPLPEPASLTSPAETLAVILEPRSRSELYRYLHRLRELAPMHRSEALHGRPAWVISNHALAYEVLSNHSLGSDSHNAEIFNTGPTGERFYELMKRTLLYIGPEEHGRLRRILARFFSPRSVGQYAPRIQTVVDGLLDQAEKRAEVDLVKDLAYALPTAVICEILGVPSQDVSSFHHWLNDFARRGDVSGVTPEVERKGEEAVIGFTEYFLDRIGERRAQPREDLMTQLIEVEDQNGKRLRDDELVAIFILMIQAGHETTADQIGLGMLGLLRHPDQLELLRREPDRISAAVEEICRYDSSNQLLQRVGREDFKLGGETVRAGEVCAILSGAANRDPAQFPDPDRLDIERPRPHHFGFGAGNHVCMGAPLARLEIKAMIGGLVSRFSGLALVEAEPELRVSLVLRGPTRLDLALQS
ncbi:MAG: cytochrome P450 [bacterium]|nr:cytochrome [Deltaproteobacteria bacterium]MCP4905342.1 cytochrome P450 [bacterium]